LRPLATQREPAELLVGLKASDDAAVYRVAPDVAIIETVDFFPPIVDDAYAAGAIAAANAMSDVYAMGGEVLFALNVVAWPDDLSFEPLERLMQGAVDKVAEGDGVIAGGHTVIDKEPKFGLAVTGRAHPDRLLTKGPLLPGDALWLTKPIGTGVLTTAHKNGDLAPEDLASAVASMVALNRAAARAAVEAGLHAATDVTGFALVGHAHEMAERSGVGIRIDASAVPLLPGARAHADRGVNFGGLERNTAYYVGEGHVRFADPIDAATRRLLLDPQTSGGLLVGVPAAHAAAWDRAREAHGVRAWKVGEAMTGHGVAVA
jgi:selenide,water dikinase